jgi:hypothetical protein
MGASAVESETGGACHAYIGAGGPRFGLGEGGPQWQADRSTDGLFLLTTWGLRDVRSSHRNTPGYMHAVASRLKTDGHRR